MAKINGDRLFRTVSGKKWKNIQLFYMVIWKTRSAKSWTMFSTRGA